MRVPAVGSGGEGGFAALPDQSIAGISPCHQRQCGCAKGTFSGQPADHPMRSAAARTIILLLRTIGDTIAGQRVSDAEIVHASSPDNLRVNGIESRFVPQNDPRGIDRRFESVDELRLGHTSPVSEARQPSGNRHRIGDKNGWRIGGWKVEARAGIEPACKDLQSSASPLRHRASERAAAMRRCLARCQHCSAKIASHLAWRRGGKGIQAAYRNSVLHN